MQENRKLNCAVNTRFSAKYSLKNQLKSGLKIGLLNICRLLSNVEIFSILHDNDIKILCLNETRLDHTISDGEIEINGFNIVRKDRNRKFGGVAIYICKTINFEIRDDLVDHSKEMIWLEIKLPHFNPFMLACLYRPPSTSKSEYLSDITTNIDKVSKLGLSIMILGDLNDDCFNIESDGLNNISNVHVCELFHLKQLVTVATRVTATSQTLIDVILSNLNDDYHTETSVIPVTLSDHYLVYTVIAYSPRPESNILTCQSFKILTLKLLMRIFVKLFSLLTSMKESYILHGRILNMLS